MTVRSRVCVSIIAGAVLAGSLVAEAQSSKVPRLGVLLYAAEPKSGQSSQLLKAFRGGLHDLGYVEGRNIVVEYRWAAGSNQHAAELAAELVRANVAVIMSAGTPATQAAKAATATIPIVMTAVGDPIGSGIVASLARPGGNVTGLSLLDTELDSKRIELLKEAVPGLTRIAMLWSPNDPGMALAFGRVEVASRTLRLTLQSLAVRDPAEVPGTLQAAETGRAQALIVTAQPFTIRHQAEILNVATKLRLPAMYTARRFVDAGGLMAYGPSLVDVYRRAATYVDRILKGANPADLPVEQPTKFEFVINRRTARTLGLTVVAGTGGSGDRVIACYPPRWRRREKEESMEPTRNRSVTIPARPESIAIDTARTAALVVDMPNDFGAMFDRAGIDISLTQAAIAHNRAARPMSFLTR